MIYQTSKSKEYQPTPSLLFEKKAVVKIVRNIRDIQNSLSDVRTKPNANELRMKARSLIEEQVQQLSGIAPELVDGIKYLIFERYVDLELQKYHADRKNGFITQENYTAYRKLYEDTLLAKASSIPENTLQRLRLMQLTKAQRRAVHDKRYDTKKRSERSAYQSKFHKNNRERNNANRRLRRAAPEYRKKEFARDILRKEQKLKEEQKANEKAQELKKSRPVQIFPNPEKK